MPDFIANPGASRLSSNCNKGGGSWRVARQKITANVRKLFEIAERHDADPHARDVWRYRGSGERRWRVETFDSGRFAYAVGVLHLARRALRSG